MLDQQINNKKLFAGFCLSALAAISLTACGGGGGGDAAAASGSSSSGSLALADSQPTGRGAAPAPAPAPSTNSQEPVSTPVLLTTSAAAPPPVITNGPYRVNTTVSGIQVRPNAARLKSGGNVVAWVSTTKGVCNQRYAASGAAVDVEVCVNANTAEQQPGLAVFDNGGYLISWIAPDVGGGHSVLVQHFNPAGLPVGDTLRVNTTAGGDPASQSITQLSGGGFVAVWRSSSLPNADVFARLLDRNGSPAGAEQRVSVSGTAVTLNGEPDPAKPAVTALSEGGYVVAWSAAVQSTNAGGAARSGIYTRRYAANGVPLAAPVLVSDASSDSTSPAMASFKNNHYAVAWRSASPENALRYTRQAVVLWATFTADGTATRTPAVAEGSIRAAPKYTCYTPAAALCYAPEGQPSLASLDNDDLVLSWSYEGLAPATTAGIAARRVSETNGMLGRPDDIPAVAYERSERPVVTARGAGGFAIVWQEPDADGTGIYASNFGAQGLTFYSFY